VPSVKQGPRQGPRYSKEIATIAKIYTDKKLVTACQGVPACCITVSNLLKDPAQPTATATIPLGTQIPTPMTPQPPVESLPQSTLPQPTLPQHTLPLSTLQQQSDPGEAAIVRKIYTDNQKYDANTNKPIYQCLQLLIDKLFVACQGVPVKAHNSIGVG